MAVDDTRAGHATEGETGEPGTHPWAKSLDYHFHSKTPNHRGNRPVFARSSFVQERHNAALPGSRYLAGAEYGGPQQCQTLVGGIALQPPTTASCPPWSLPHDKVHLQKLSSNEPAAGLGLRDLVGVVLEKSGVDQ